MLTLFLNPETLDVKYVKTRIRQPVSVGELWDNWIKYPELVKHVDFIAAHIFPYWSGMPIETAIGEMQRRYEQLHRAYPDKPIVIAEAGWPSNGGGQFEAKASLQNEARFLREFINFADKQHYNYDLMEAL